MTAICVDLNLKKLKVTDIMFIEFSRIWEVFKKLQISPFNIWLDLLIEKEKERKKKRKK